MTHSVRSRMIKLGILFCAMTPLVSSVFLGSRAQAKSLPKPAPEVKPDSVYSRNHNIKALFTVTPVNFDNFAEGAGKTFSLLKYGNQKNIDEYSETLLNLIWKDHADEISAHPDEWLIVSPATFNLPTSAVLVSEAIEKLFVKKYGLNIKKVSLKRRSTNSIDFGSLTNMADRQSHIKNNFFYDGPSLANKKLLFIEDALVSGTHYKESQRTLVEEGKVKHKNLFAYFLVNVEQSGIKSSDFSLESKLNQITMAPDTPERLLPILRNPSNSITPRMLKYVFKSHSRTTFFCLNLNYESLARVYQASLTDGFNHKKDFKANVASVGLCTEHRLAEEKELMRVEALHKVNIRTIKNVVNDKTLYHPGFSEKISLATMYSLLKFGDAHAVEYFASQISRKIKSKFGRTRGFPKRSWAIATTGYAGTPGAASYLTKEIAKKLNLKILESSRKTTPTVSYSNLSGASERKSVVEDQFEFMGKVPRNLIYIDDSIASGAHVREYAKKARENRALLHPFVILDIESADCSLEAQINSNIVEQTGIKGFAEVINNPETPVLLRTLKTILAFSQEQSEEIFRRLSAEKSDQIVQAMIKENFHKKKVFAKKFEQISRFLKQLKGKDEGNTHHALLESSGSSDKNALLRNFRTGSLMARSQLKWLFKAKIQDLLGSQLKNNPQNFILASAPYYFKPNAMAYLTKDLAADLGLSSVDIRSKSHFSRDDSMEQDVNAAQHFFSNHKKVAGKTVLYLDTVFGRGDRLSEVKRLCNTHLCKGVVSISVVTDSDKAGQSESSWDLKSVNDMSPMELLTALKGSVNPFVAETVHKILTLDESHLRIILNALSTDQIFNLVNSAEYDLLHLSNDHKSSYEIVNQMALDLHNNLSVRHSPLDKIKPRLMIIDYDKTLSATLTSPEKSTMKSLEYYLTQGGYLCIISMQPIGERGLTENFFEPFKNYLASQNKTSLLRNIWLLPSAGSSAYRPDKNLAIDIDQPVYQVGLLPDEFVRLSRVVAETVDGVASKIYYRDTYISMHFLNESQKLIGLEKLNAVFGRSRRFEVIESIVKHPTKKVLHVRPVDLSKQMGKSFALEVIKKELEQATGKVLLNAEIVTAGDKMGVSAGQTSDSDLFTYGATNFALGKEARPGARGELLGTYEKGFTNWLEALSL